MKNDLKVHMTQVHKGWKCNQCGKRLNSYTYLVVHNQNKHGENIEVLVKPAENSFSIDDSMNNETFV